MNSLPLVLDGFAVLIIGLSSYFGFKKGLLLTFLGFVPFIAGVLGVWFLTPILASLLINTPIYSVFLKGLSESFSFLDNISLMDSQNVMNFITELNLPEFLKETLFVNNNPVVHEMLGVSSLGAYVSNFLSTICVNILSAILVFIAVVFGCNFLIKGLNLISSLPILNFANKISGLVVGFAKAIIVIWIIFVILFLFQCNGWFLNIFYALENSSFAIGLYENNLLLQLILKIFNV